MLGATINDVALESDPPALFSTCHRRRGCWQSQAHGGRYDVLEAVLSPDIRQIFRLNGTVENSERSFQRDGFDTLDVREHPGMGSGIESAARCFFILSDHRPAARECRHGEGETCGFDPRAL